MASGPGCVRRVGSESKTEAVGRIDCCSQHTVEFERRTLLGGRDAIVSRLEVVSRTVSVCKSGLVNRIVLVC